MGLIDIFREAMNNKYGETWINPLDSKKCEEEISRFFKRSNSSILACINKESLYYKDFEENLNKTEAKKEIKYHNGKLSFIIGDESNILFENYNKREFFIKYQTKNLANKLIKTFYDLKSKSS